MGKKRVEWIDIAKYICIICVIATHLESMTDVLREFFEPFFLMLFFFCSGYVYNHQNGFKRFLNKKIRQLFIPWLVFSLFLIITSQIISFNEKGNLFEKLFWNFLQIREKDDQMWFVAALFAAYIPFYFFIKWYEQKETTSKRVTYITTISFSLSLISMIYSMVMPSSYFPWGSANLPWHAEYIFQGMFFMTLGYLFKTVYEAKFDFYNTVSLRIILAALYLCTVYIPYLLDVQIKNVPCSIIYTYIKAILGAAAVISICKVIKNNRYIAYIGQNTLICFGLHGKLLTVIQAVFQKFAGSFYAMILDNVLISSGFAIILALVMSVILIVPIWIINRYFPFAAGRYRMFNHE